MKLKNAVCLLATCTVLSSCGFADLIGAKRAHNYFSVIHSEDAAGVGIGAEAPFRNSALSFGVEAGIFRDSDDETTGFGLAQFELDLRQDRTRSPRLGAFFGFVNDAEVARRFEDRYPVIGNFAPIVGFQATVPTYGPHELRLRVAPGLSANSAIFTLQSNFVF